MDIKEMMPDAGAFKNTPLAQELNTLHVRLLRAEQETLAAIKKVYGEPRVLTEAAATVSDLKEGLIPHMHSLNDRENMTSRPYTALTEKMLNVINPEKPVAEKFTAPGYGGEQEQLLTSNVAVKELGSLLDRVVVCQNHLKGKPEFARLQAELKSRNAPELLASVSKHAAALVQELKGGAGQKFDAHIRKVEQFAALQAAGQQFAAMTKPDREPDLDGDRDTPTTALPDTIAGVKAMLAGKLQRQEVAKLPTSKGYGIVFLGNGLETLKGMLTELDISTGPVASTSKGEAMLRIRTESKDKVLGLMPAGFKLDAQQEVLAKTQEPYQPHPPHRAARQL